MKSAIAKFLEDALSRLPELADAASGVAAESTIERTRDAAHGHFASNLAMRLAKPARRSPRDLAAAIVEQIAETDQLEKVEIAGPGFINFYLSPAAFHAEIRTILGSGEDYGRHAPKRRPASCSSSCPRTPPARCTLATAGMRRTARRWATCSKPSATRFTASTT